MAATFTDPTTSPEVIPTGTTVKPFSKVVVTESTLPAAEVLTITFSPGIDIRTLSDPQGGGIYNLATNSLAYNSTATAVPTTATEFLQRLDYKPPVLTNGNFAETAATISVKSGLLPAVTDTSTTLETVTQPAITGTFPNAPVASGVGAAIRPFATVRITDDSPGFNAKDTGTITVTDASGTPSDADGLLSGTGLSKTGVGTYTVVTAFFFEVQNNLEGLVFTPSAVAAGSTRTTGFKLNIRDAATSLNTDDTMTSVLVIGPAVTPTAPLIAGTVAGQTVAPGNAISPFNGVTISDANTTPMDSATLTVTGGGTLSGAGLSAGGTYTIAATTPAALTAILDRVSFAAPALAVGQTSVTSSITLKVIDGADHHGQHDNGYRGRAVPTAPTTPGAQRKFRGRRPNHRATILPGR